ncbi:MAG: Bro-N domain-containing protein [Chitinophagales bacterium]|nr:Bro-N domain-containing protein [Chitinophagales bacterium]
MSKENAIKIFEQNQVRTYWDEEQDKWYFSIVDVIAVLTDQATHQGARNYWKVLKNRLSKEGNETVTNCNRLKMLAEDGKMRFTDIADTEQLFRLIQSVPSKKAEPFKQWLARVGRERIDEIEDPEIGIDRLMETYLKKGYSKEWINQRLKSIEVRKELTDEWENRGVKKGQEYAILTDEITKAWSGFSVKQYKQHKGLKKENLRDNMTNLELVLNMLAEATTTEISKEKKPKNFTQNKIIAKQGGTIAGNTRREIEAKTGKRVVTNLNAKTALKGKDKPKQIPKEK